MAFPSPQSAGQIAATFRGRLRDLSAEGASTGTVCPAVPGTYCHTDRDRSSAAAARTAAVRNRAAHTGAERNTDCHRPADSSRSAGHIAVVAAAHTPDPAHPGAEGAASLRQARRSALAR